MAQRTFGAHYFETSATTQKTRNEVASTMQVVFWDALHTDSLWTEKSCHGKVHAIWCFLVYIRSFGTFFDSWIPCNVPIAA